MLEVMSASGDTAYNLRAGPGRNYEVVGEIAPGQLGRLSDVNENGTWLKLDTGEKQGWLAADLVVVTGEMVLDVPAPTSRTRQGLVQAWEAVNVRRGPDRSFRSIGRLTPGQVALVLGKNGDGTWWQIQFEGEMGWVADEAVQFAGVSDDVADHRADGDSFAH